MIFKHKKLSESAVMREFERVAIEKGMVKIPEESIISKKASVSYEPSSDLICDMLTLATGLRERGFEKDATALEEKVLTYKLAETHLYRAIDEDAEDMLEFAHPKKNKVQFDAANGDGEVEDTLSQHKKIIDIVNKQPKKTASDVLAETADILGLKKKADLDETGKNVELVKYYKNQLIKFAKEKNAYYSAHYQSSAFVREGDDNVLSIGIEDYEYVLIEGYSKTWDFPDKKAHVFESKCLEYFCNANNIIPEKQFADLKNGDVSFKELITPEGVNYANGNLQKLYKTFFEKIDNIPSLSSTSQKNDIDNAINNVKSLFDDNSWFIIKCLTNNDGLIENKIRKTASQLIEVAQNLNNLTNKPSSLTGMDKVLDPGFANIIAGRFESVADKDPDPSYFKHVAELIRANGGKPYKDLYTELVQFDKDLTGATDETKLDLVGQKWQKGYKVASKSENLVKEAKDPNSLPAFAPSSKTPATVPTTYNKPAGRNAGRAAVKEKSTFEQAFPAEFEAVSTMQISLQSLAENLDKLGISPTNQVKMKNILLGTGGVQGKFNGNTDGIWGERTAAALQEANVILASHGEKEKLTTEAQRINGELQNNHTTEDVAKYAIANANIINKVLEGVGAKQKSNNLVDNDNSSYLDSLPVNSNLLATDPIIDEDKVNGIPLSESDLSSFSSLFQFIKANRFPVDTSAGGFDVKNWENVLDWFYVRARKQASLLKTKNKLRYFVVIRNLYKKLSDLNLNVNDAKIISPTELDGVKSTGPTQNAAYKSTTNQNADGAEVATDVNTVEPPPFGNIVNISALKQSKYSGGMSKYNDYGQFLKIPMLDINAFSDSPQQLSSIYVKELTPNQVLYLNNVNPNSPLPGQTPKSGEKVFTYLDLMSPGNAERSPTAMHFQKTANDLALLSIISGLSSDLSNISNAYFSTNPPDKFAKIMLSTWTRWAETLKEAYSRASQDFTDQGRAPRINFQ